MIGCFTLVPGCPRSFPLTDPALRTVVGEPAAVIPSEPCDWPLAELVSEGTAVRLAAPANMLQRWVTENKPSRGPSGQSCCPSGLPHFLFRDAL